MIKIIKRKHGSKTYIGGVDLDTVQLSSFYLIITCNIPKCKKLKAEYF